MAAQLLAPCKEGPVLIVGAGVQGTAHLQAFAEAMAVTGFRIASRTAVSTARLVAHAQSLGLGVRVLLDADTALTECPMAVACTPTSAVALGSLPRPDDFIAAVGVFAPETAGLSPATVPALCRPPHHRGRYGGRRARGR